MIPVRKSNLTARLATNKLEIEAAQRLRYNVFYQEFSAVPDAKTLKAQRDFDEFDEICDHVLVLNNDASSPSSRLGLDGGELVGTYRLLPQNRAQRHFGFYSQTEFDVAPLLAANKEQTFLELGRSCVAKPFRTKPVLELLWQAIWNYVRLHKFDVLFGCASIEGTDRQELKLRLNHLLSNYHAPAKWMVSAQPDQNCLNAGDNTLSTSENRRAFSALPPLIRSYLKIGAYIGHEAVIDFQFNVTDIFVTLPISKIDEKYFHRFGFPKQDYEK